MLTSSPAITYALPRVGSSISDLTAISHSPVFCYGRETDLTATAEDATNTTAQGDWQNACETLILGLKRNKHRHETYSYAKNAELFQKQTPFTQNWPGAPGGRWDTLCQYRIDLLGDAEADTLSNNVAFPLAESIDLGCIGLDRYRPSHLGGYVMALGNGHKLILTFGKYPLPTTVDVLASIKDVEGAEPGTED